MCRIKKRWLRLVMMLSASAGILGGCGPHGPETPSSTVPQVFYDLLEAAQNGRTLEKVWRENNRTEVRFTDGGTLSIPTEELFIYDCTESEPAGLYVKNGNWMVGQKDSGIPVLPTETDDRECSPVYVYYTYSTICMCLSNGKELVIRGTSASGKYKIPIVRIETDGAREILDKENYVPGSIVIEDPDGLYSDVPTFESRMGIRGRGNTTWGMPKKPWKVKLDEKASVLGMPTEKDWALLANYSDKTLLRNITAMEISRILGFRWTPRMVSVEVYLNGEYQGVYSFSEHKEVGKYKVNIDILKATDNEGEAVTGGYYIEIDGSLDEPFSFWTDVGIPVMVKDPENPTDSQRAYIRQLFKDFETALYSEDFADPVKGYAAFIDVPSFIDYYIIQELSKNVDGNLRKSCFISKERGGKMEMCHVWDFDIAFGNCNYFPDFWPGATNTYEGWFIRDYINYSYKCDGWYGCMFKDPVFVEQLKKRWNEVVPELRLIPEYIDRNVELLGPSVARNFKRWDILGKQVWPNVAVFGTYAAEVSYLKEFYSSRLEWLNREINAL